MRDSHVGCVLYNGKDNHYQIRSWIQIMRNVRVLSNHERALLAHPCTFGEKIARFGKSRFQVIIVLHQSQMITEIIEFTSYESFSIIQSLPQCQNNSVSMIKQQSYVLNNHNCMASYYIISYKKMFSKMSSAKWRKFGLDLNVLTHCSIMASW